jgi:hypothetical protein
MERNIENTDQANQDGSNVDMSFGENGVIFTENTFQHNFTEVIQNDEINGETESKDEADFPNIEDNIERNVGEVLFYVQAAVLIIVVLACIINLSLVNGDQSSWTALLSASLGILVPQPTISLNLKNNNKKKKNNKK